MSKSNLFETDILKLIFQNVAIAGIGDATGLAGSAAAGSLYASVHIADPGEAGDQTTNEISYTGYARQALVRNATNFPVANGVMSLGVNVDFPEMSGGTGGVITHWGVGTSSSGAGYLLYSGACSPTVNVQIGSIPRVKGTPSGTPSTISED